MEKIRLRQDDKRFDTELHISGSKSISNRVLIIQALSNQPFSINNLSDSDDTRVLAHCLGNLKQEVLDVQHAGTSYRFLTALLAVMPGTHVLTGSQRMKERPVGPLVNALREIGADIQYLEKDGFPPLRIGDFRKQQKDGIIIQSDVSSQFISALCLIAPILEKGLWLELDGKLVSRPYLKMTLDIMASFGIRFEWKDNRIKIPPRKYTVHDYTVESDWSSASYPLAMVALSPGSRLRLRSFFDNSLQGDRRILDMIAPLGLEYSFEGDTLEARHKDVTVSGLAYDFIDQPDMYQTVAVLAAAKSIKLKARGLKTLAIKETDRIKALKNELSKVSVRLEKDTEPEWEYILEGTAEVNLAEFKSYEDHRMAMALSLLACHGEISINNPDVVSKSYPGYWDDLAKMGFHTARE